MAVRAPTYGEAALDERPESRGRELREKCLGSYLDIGGFDNHNTLEALPGRLQIIDDAVSAFAAELTAQGVFDDVVLASASDFGRTLTWNGPFLSRKRT